MKNILLFAVLSICTYVTCYATITNSTIHESPTVNQNVEYIKTVTYYCNINGVIKEGGRADLYKQPWGYSYRYFIQLQGTGIQLLVNPRNYNTPKGFNSWSVDNWGYCYFYNI